MHHAGLHRRQRPGRGDRLGQTGEAVAAQDQHVLHAAAAELGADSAPELSPLGGLQPDAEHVLDALGVDAHSEVSVFPDLEVGRYYLSGHSTLRGLTFLEVVVELPEMTELPSVFAGSLTLMIIEAEGIARGGESEEFSLVMAEAFWLGEEHLPEAVFLDDHLKPLGIGGVDSPPADKWTSLLSSYYNPVARRPGEVQVRKTLI